VVSTQSTTRYVWRIFFFFFVFLIVLRKSNTNTRHTAVQHKARKVKEKERTNQENHYDSQDKRMPHHAQSYKRSTQAH
jgi:preprotein translocase subunit SecG